MPLNIDFQQILLHMFNVVLLFGILYLLLYKPVKDFMDKRAKEYADMDAEAKAALEKAKQEQSAYEQKLQNVQQELDRKREASVKAQEVQAARILDNANAEAASILAKARAEGSAEHDRLIANARGELRDMITSAAQKLAYKDTSEAYDSFLLAGKTAADGQTAAAEKIAVTGQMDDAGQTAAASKSENAGNSPDPGKGDGNE